MNEIGKNIYIFRKMAGLTQQQLAERLNMAKSTIGNYESGIRTPDLYTLRAIARELNVDPAELIRDHDFSGNADVLREDTAYPFTDSDSAEKRSPYDAIREKELLDTFRQLTKDNRDIILGLAKKTLKEQRG